MNILAFDVRRAVSRLTRVEMHNFIITFKRSCRIFKYPTFKIRKGVSRQLTDDEDYKLYRGKEWSTRLIRRNHTIPFLPSPLLFGA